MDALQQRKHRAYQAKHRGGGTSSKTALENTQMLMALEAGLLSEGQVSAALSLDRVTVRKMRDDAIDSGIKFATLLLKKD